jgi:hypothetical protein
MSLTSYRAAPPRVRVFGRVSAGSLAPGSGGSWRFPAGDRRGRMSARPERSCPGGFCPAVAPGRVSPGCHGDRVGRAAGAQKDAGRLREIGGPARHPAWGHHEEKLSIVRFVDLAATYSPAS